MHHALAQSSYNEQRTGASIAWHVRAAPHWRHVLLLETVWRQVRDVPPTADFAIRAEAGHSLKTALRATSTYDTRNEEAAPTAGSLAQLAVELAGLGPGSVQHVRVHAMAQRSVSMPPRGGWVRARVACSAAPSAAADADAPAREPQWSIGAASAGLLLPLGRSRSSICDRFFLGGPVSLRGFTLHGAGLRVKPHDPGDPARGVPPHGCVAAGRSVARRTRHRSAPLAADSGAYGGELFWLCTAHAFWPLLRRWPSAGDAARHALLGHVFVDAGALAASWRAGTLALRGGGGGGRARARP